MNLEDLLAQERETRAKAEAAAVQAERLQSMMSALGGALAPRNVARIVIDQGISALGASVGLLVLRGDGVETLDVLASSGFPDDMCESSRRRAALEGTPVERSIETGQAVFARPAAGWGTTRGNAGLPYGTRVNAWAAFPIQVNRTCSGSLAFGFSEDKNLSEQDQDFMAALARHCGQALERGRLYSEVRAAVSIEKGRGLQLRAVADAGLAINSATTFDSILQVMADQVREIIGAHLVFVQVADTRDESARRIFVSSSDRYAVWNQFPAELMSSLESTLRLDSSHSTRIAVDELDRHMPQDTFGLAADAPGLINGLLAVPLVDRGASSSGLVCVVDKVRNEFSEDDEAIVVQLAHMAAIAIENARLREQAEAAIQARDAFISSASHDLKTPIVSVKGIAQMLRRQVMEEPVIDRKRVARGLENIDIAASRMNAMINDLSNTVRLQWEHPSTLNRQVTDLVSVAHDAAREQEQASEGRTIVVETPVAHLWGTWDTGRIHRVLANLLSNAIKYSPGGGDIRLIVNQDESDGKQRAVVSVSDTGLGIPQADMPHIYTRYHRGRNVPARSSGSGVGLAAVKEIVEQHGGTIEVESVEGTGTTFTVRLPVEAE